MSLTNIESKLQTSLIGIALFNWTDTLVTEVLVHSSRAAEMNPLMARLLLVSPALFMCVKLLGVPSLLYWFWRRRDHELVYRAVPVLLFFYITIVTYETFMIFTEAWL